MRQFLEQLSERDDRRMLAAGAAAAVVAGVLCGAVLKPDLGADHTLGPQTISGDGGLHAATWRPDPGVSVYGGRVPDYVVGTDWTRPRREVAYAPAQEAAAHEDAVIYTSDERYEPPMEVRRQWAEDERRASSYPSMDGDVRYRGEAPSDDGDQGAPGGDPD